MRIIVMTPYHIAKLPERELGLRVFALRKDNWLYRAVDSNTLFLDTIRSSIQINGKSLPDQPYYDADAKDEEKNHALERWIKQDLLDNNEADYATLYPRLKHFYSQLIVGTFYTQMQMATMNYFFIDKNSTPNLSHNIPRTCELSYQNGVIRLRASFTGFEANYTINGVEEKYSIPGSLQESYILTEQGFKLEWVEFTNPLIAQLATKNFVDCRVWMQAVANESDQEAALWKHAPRLLEATRKEQEMVSENVFNENEDIFARKAKMAIDKANKLSALKPVTPPKKSAAPAINADHRLLDRSLRAYLRYLINKVIHYLTPIDAKASLGLMIDPDFLMKPSHTLPAKEQASRAKFIETTLAQLTPAQQPIANKLKLILMLRDTLHTPGLTPQAQIAAAKAQLTPQNRALLNLHRDRFSRFIEKVLRKVFSNHFVDQHLRLFQSKGARQVQMLLRYGSEPERKEKARHELNQ